MGTHVAKKHRATERFNRAGAYDAICEKFFSRGAKLNEHIRGNHLTHTRRYKCPQPGCEACRSELHAMNTHLRHDHKMSKAEMNNVEDYETEEVVYGLDELPDDNQPEDEQDPPPSGRGPSGGSSAPGSGGGCGIPV